MQRSAEARGLRTVGHSTLNGYGDGMQLMCQDDVLYVGHFGTSGMGTSILDVRDPTTPAVVEQWPAPTGSHTHKTQVGEQLLLINQERFRGGDPHAAGMAVMSLEDPFHPRTVGYYRSTGLGVHRIVWTGGDYAYLSATPEGFDDRIWVVVDMRDPERPVEAGRWWWPGAWVAGGERPSAPEGRRYAAHHALVDGNRAYLGYGDAGMVILDISDPVAPTYISHIGWSPGGSTHTALPLPDRDLVVVTDEQTRDGCEAEARYIRVVDVSDERYPRVAGVCPPPEDEFCRRGLRFGPHNLHENRPGSYRSQRIVFATYFNAGLRVYDVSDPAEPEEIAHWIPETPPGQEAIQINDLFVDAEHRIHVSDRGSGGVYIVEPEEALGRRMSAAAD